MPEPVHDNLRALYRAFSRDAIEGIFTGESYMFDDVEFVSKYAPGSTADRFYIVKSIQFVEYFVEFCKDFRHGSIFELGIAEGGSTALLALVTQPRKLVAIDVEPRRLKALDDFTVQRGLQDRVRLHYSIDQSDKTRLRQLVATEFGASGIDLVLDDASHALGPTRASFEALFPNLNPGGVFTIEDWNADIVFRDAVKSALQHPPAPDGPRRADSMPRVQANENTEAQSPPAASLSQLAVELVLAAASSPEVVAEVTMNQYWIMVRRGPAEIDATEFRIEDLYTDYFGFLPSL
jgi:hypothetical protein